MLSKKVGVLLVIALSLTMIISSLQPATKNQVPKAVVNSPPSNGTLYDFWNGNAYFDRQTYNVQGWSSGNPVHEVAAVLKDGDPNTIYLYYRSYVDANGNPLTGGHAGIGLAISTDGGATFSLYNSGRAIVNPGSGCDSDSMYAIAPSVVVVSHTYYMVYEGRSSGGFCSYISPGDVNLAVSSDGKTWTKLGILIYHDLFNWECANIGTPFVGFFNPSGAYNYYVFYHGSCFGADGNRRNKIGMAYGSALTNDGVHPASLTKNGNPVMDIGKGKYSWDSYVNSRASIVQETGSDGKVYYYMTYEGSQDTQSSCSGGNWGWGIARSTDLVSWTKYPYNPIRQNYGGGCGSDLPYIFLFNGAVTVYQVWDTTNCCPSSPGVRNILLSGTDPYLGVWPALSQCMTWHRIGRADGDGWSANNAQDSPGYLCYGPYNSPGQHLYSTTFIDMIDTCCLLFNTDKTITQDIFDDNLGSSVKTTDIYRNDFVLSGQYEGFNWQFSAVTGHSYEWRTNWYQKAYIKQQTVFLRQLDDFGILPSQSSTSVQLGSTGSFTLSASSWQGFSGTIALSTSVSPSTGLSVSCPSSISSTGTGTCNLSGTNSGTYVVTITGTGDGLTHSTTASVSVTGFTLTTNPTLQTIPLGSEMHVTVTATSVGGFSGPVNLVMTPSSSSVACWFTTLTNTATINVPAGSSASEYPACTTGSPAGTYPVSIAATSGSIGQTVAFNVNAADFSMSAPVVAFTSGSSATGTVTVSSLAGLSGTVNLASSAPSGLSISCPGSVSLASGSSAPANCTFSSSTPGTYTATVTGSYTCTSCYYAGTDSHTLSITVYVQTFSISENPTFQSIPIGSERQTTVTLTSVGGFAGTVNLVEKPSSPAVTCWFTTLTNTSSVYVPANGSNQEFPTCTTGSPAGAYTVTITGTSGSLVQKIVLNVNSTDFSMSAPYVYFTSGSSANGTISLTSLAGLSGPVSLSVSSPTQVSVSCPSTVTLAPGSMTPATCSFSSSAGGSYTVTVTASFKCTNCYYNGVDSHSVSITVNVQDFTISESPTFQSIPAGSEQQTVITVSSVGSSTERVNLAAKPSSSAVACWFTTLTNMSSVFVSGSTSYEFPTCTGGLAGVYTVTVTGSVGLFTHSVVLNVNVTDFSMTAPAVSLPTGSSASGTITIASLFGLSGTISLAVSSPSAVSTTCPTSVNLPSGGTAGAACTFSSSTPGTYSVTATSSFTCINCYYNAKITHSLTVTVNVGDFTITLNPSSATVTKGFGVSASSTITLQSLYSFAGTITLTTQTSPQTNNMPTTSLSASTVTVTANGSGTATVTLLTNSSTTKGTYVVTVTAKAGSITHTGTFTVTVN